MKIQCVLCKEIVSIGEFESSSEGIRVSCAGCGERFFLPRSGRREAARRIGEEGEPADPEADSEAPPVRSDDSEDCPKCLQPVGADEIACPGCGLLCERFASFAAAAAAEVPEALELAWQRCREAWDQDARHDEFITTAAASGSYAFAARRYREVLRDRPGDAAARRRLQRISRMAEAAMMVERSARAEEESATPYKGVLILLLFLLVIGGGLGIYMLTKSAAGPERPPVPARTTR